MLDHPQNNRSWRIINNSSTTDRRNSNSIQGWLAERIFNLREIKVTQTCRGSEDIVKLLFLHSFYLKLGREGTYNKPLVLEQRSVRTHCFGKKRLEIDESQSAFEMLLQVINGTKEKPQTAHLFYISHFWQLCEYDWKHEFKRPI